MNERPQDPDVSVGYSGGPYNGADVPATASPREITLGSQTTEVPGPNGHPMAVFNNQAPQVFNSTGPQYPEQAARGAELGLQNGRLIEELGQMRRANEEMQRTYQQQLDELRFQVQLASAAGQVGQIPNQPAAPVFNQAPAQPLNLAPEDLEQPINVGQFAQALNGLQQMLTQREQLLQTQFQATLQAQNIRFNARLTPQEESDAIARNPQINSYPEPTRSQLLVQAVEMQRRYTQPAQMAQTPATPVAPSAPQRAITEPQQPYGYHSAPSTPPPTVMNQSDLAARWAASEKITDQATKDAEQKAIFDEAVNRHMGGLDGLLSSAWVSRS